MGFSVGASIRRGLARARTFGQRLSGDARGNTLVIVGAALVPLAAMIGSGVDLSRAYMAHARLQQACDAGALAGRRAMTTNVVDKAVEDEAIKFFKFNFPVGKASDVPSEKVAAAFNVKPFTPTVKGATDSPTTVVVSATTEIPTSVMSMFGFDYLPLTVTCNAKLDFVNTDVMLVLDVTGSMLDDVNNNKADGGPTSKIVALRAAVLAFYDQLKPVQNKLEKAGMRMRYGIVPYSTNVNIGKVLYAKNTNWIAGGNVFYQTRERQPKNPVDYLTATTSYPDGSTWVTGATTYTPWGNPTTTLTGVTDANCKKTASSTTNGTASNQTPVVTGPNADGVRVTETTEQRTNTWTEYNKKSWTETKTSNHTGTCVLNSRTASQVQTRLKERKTETPKWAWYQVRKQYNVGSFVTGATVTTYTGDSGLTTTSKTGSAVTSTWGGCIEERTTVDTITSASGLTPPAGAFDMDILSAPDPTKDETKWVPLWPAVEYSSSTSQPSAPCPTAEAKPLQVWDRASLETYLNSLAPVGATYHGVGLVWGARLVMGNGMFASATRNLPCKSTASGNPETYCGMGVSRFLIFLTDGILNAEQSTYTAYGLESLDKRVTGGYTTDADHESRHLQRFKMLCQEIKDQNVSLWVISFASTLTTDMEKCATTKDQASLSKNSSELTAKFKEIGENIGALRLTQ